MIEWIWKRRRIDISGFEEFFIQQGALFFGFFVLVGVSYLFFNAIVRKD